MRRKANIICAVVGIVAFFAALGTVGGVEHGYIGLMPGAVRAFVCMVVCAACIAVAQED